MSEIINITGTKDNITEDIRTFSETLIDNPEIIVVSRKDIKNKVIETSSTLFINNNIVLALVDPEIEILKKLKEHLMLLKDRVQIIIYFTAPEYGNGNPIEGKTVVIKKNKETRFRDRVLSLLKKHNKVMTDKAFKLFREMIVDESTTESELMKLINYTGIRREIKSGDVKAIVTVAHEENLLNLFDTIAQTDKKEMMDSLETLLSNGMNMLGIQGFLVKQARLMLHAKDMEEILKANHEYPAFSKFFSKWKENIQMEPLDKKIYLPWQKPYYAFKLSKTSQSFSRKKLISIINMLMEVDTRIKSGTKQERMLLEQGLTEA